MTVTVKGHGSNRRYAGEGVEVSSLKALTAEEAAAMAGIPEDEVGPMVRGGARVLPAEPLAEGDVLSVYPPIVAG